MKKGLGIILSIVSISSFGQVLSFGIGQPFKDFRKMEANFRSLFQENNSTEMLARGMAQPITYLRTSDNFEPKPIVQYYFAETDSIVHGIQYEWDKNNFVDEGYRITDKDIESKERLTLFIEKYKDLKSEVRSRFGIGKTEGSLEPKSGISYLDVDIEDSWENDSISIVMYMTFSNLYKVNGNMSTVPTHRIRVYVNSKKDNNDDLSSELMNVFKANNKQQDIAIKYIKLLLDGKFKDSWRMISKEIKSKTTYDDYLKVVSVIPNLKDKYGNEVQLALSGPKFINGDVCYFYSYRFLKDKDSSMLLDVTFKVAEDLIIGFTPKTLSRN